MAPMGQRATVLGFVHFATAMVAAAAVSAVLEIGGAAEVLAGLVHHGCPLVGCSCAVGTVAIAPSADRRGIAMTANLGDVPGKGEWE